MIESRIQDAFQHAFELLWSFCFRLIGHGLRPRYVGPRFAGPRPEIVRPAGKQRILVVAPHPDDEVAGCAGTLFEHRRCDDRVSVAYVTDGRRSRACGLGPEEMAAKRRREAEEATRVLGAELEWLGLPEGDWPPEELSSLLRELLARLRPHVVYAPSRVDFHYEHERVARALAAALDDGALSPLCRVYPVQVPLTPVLADVCLPLAEARRVQLALSCHATQIGSLRRCLRLRRYSACLLGLPGLVEEFWQLDAGRYRRLHREPPPRPLVETFRGLRYYAWSDPLAYLRGFRERRRLAGIGRPIEVV